jgi:hypothetical protein
MGAVPPSDVSRRIAASGGVLMAIRMAESQAILVALTRLLVLNRYSADAWRAFDVAHDAVLALVSPDEAMVERVKRMRGAAFGVEARGRGREVHELGLNLKVARVIYTAGEDGPARAVANLRVYLADAHPERVERVEDATLRTAIEGMRDGGKLSGAVHAVLRALGFAHSLATVSKAIRAREKKRSTPK